MLGTRFIRELLMLVDNAPDETEWLTTERDRLQTEVQRLIDSIAAGVPADSVAPSIREREDQIHKVEKRINRPRVPRPDQTRLLAALEQRAEQWKAELRAEPQVARMVLRRLVGPLTLWDEGVVGKRPDFIRWEANPTMELLDGLAPHLSIGVPDGSRTAWTDRQTAENAVDAATRNLARTLDQFA